MSFSWEQITIIANLIASLSIFSGIIVYKIGKSDAEIHEIQRSIIKLRTNVQSLDQNFRTELFSEMASATIYSASMQSIYPKLLTPLNEKIEQYQHSSRKEQGTIIEAGVTELLEIVRGIPASVSTSLVFRTEDKIERLITEALPFTPHFSGLERIAQSVAYLYRQLLDKYRAICLDCDKSWRIVFSSIISDEGAIMDVEHLKHLLCSYLVALQNKIASEHDQQDIDTMVKITNLTCNAYLSQSTFQLKKLRKKGVSLVPFETFDTYVEQFSEAKKDFRMVFSRDEENAYSNYVKEFEINNQ